MFQNTKIISVIILVLTTAVYMVTLAPTVMFIDSGELAADASTLGIAHPTGYPFFTIIGYLFTRLPFSPGEVYKLNFMGALFCVAAVIVFFQLMNFLLAGAKQLPKYQLTAAALFSSFLLAFSNTYWAQANSVEVYSLHVFFLVTLSYFFLKGLANDDIRFLILFSFLLGLSFTNHMTTILLAPACITLFFVRIRTKAKPLLKLLGYMGIFFLLGFSVYLYLPIRASASPLFLWGNPYNLERFIWHITGKQFSVWIFSAKGSIPVFLFLVSILIGVSWVGLVKFNSLTSNYHFGAFLLICFFTYIVLKLSGDIVIKQFNFFQNSLMKEYGPGLVILALPGVYRLSRFDLTFFYFTLLSFFACVFYSVNYDIHDISSYFLLSYIIIAVWMGFGAMWLFERAASALKTKTSRAVFTGVIVLTVLISLKANFGENDESKEYFVQQYTMNLFKNIEPNGILISSQWDFCVSASWYYQAVKNVRKDIAVIDKELLRRSWYYVYLNRHYPEIYERSKPEIERFLDELYKFERNIPYDQRTIMKVYSDLLTSFVEKNPDRKVYTTWEIEQVKEEAFAQNYERIPDGLLFQLSRKDTQPVIQVHAFDFDVTDKNDYYHETIMGTYAMMLSNSAYYLYTQNRIDDAKKYLEMALRAKPNLPKVQELRKKLGL